MHFIKQCNGKFDNEKDQSAYNDMLTSLTQGHQQIDEFIYNEVKARLTPDDKHHDLIEATINLSKSSLNLSQQIASYLILDLYEYSLKNQHKAAKHKRFSFKREKDDPVMDLFKKLQPLIFMALSMLEGAQTLETLWKYFNSKSPHEIQIELQEALAQADIQDADLIDGFMKCRKEYGFFLSEANEANRRFDETSKKYDAATKSEFGERWNKIKSVITEGLIPLMKAESAKETAASVKDPAARNIMQFMNIHGALETDRQKRQKEFHQQLDDLFTPYRTGQKLTM